MNTSPRDYPRERDLSLYNLPDILSANIDELFHKPTFSISHRHRLFHIRCFSGLNDLNGIICMCLWRCSYIDRVFILEKTELNIWIRINSLFSYNSLTHTCERKLTPQRIIMHRIRTQWKEKCVQR